jgi:hypothetical protein
MLIMPRASNHKPSGKSATLRTSPSRLKTGGTKFFNNRINPISVMFNPRHALLLRPRRILCPRNSRGIDAQRMRHSPLSWTRTRTGRDRELPANLPQTRTGQNCGLALTSARPRTQTRTRPGHELDLAATTTSPQTGRGRELDNERPYYLKIIFINTPPFYVRI